MDDLEKFTKLSLQNISKDCDIVIIDGIGTMELFSNNFKNSVKSLLNSNIPVIAVLHRHYKDEYGGFGKIYDLKEERYEDVKQEIKEILRKDII